jgi:Gas vesicle synthesis protein GvpL/GvpF
MADATYVYCVVASTRRPRIRLARGLPGTGRVRLLEVDRKLWMAVADAPLSRYGERAIDRGLSNVDWVSRAAVAHEAVVESFISAAAAVLPMKLFTIFTSDERAAAHIRVQRPRIAALVKVVGGHHEWSVRVVMDRARAVRRAPRAAAPTREAAGAAYLVRKKARRDAAQELATRARETVAALYDRLAARSRLARRRGASELPVPGGPLLLDAAFLVARGRTATFRGLARREARALARHGYGLTLTGPWPPYSFVQD